MSANEREKLWMAYLDGQMSVTEAAAFDDSLSPEEREQLAAEMRIESGIAEALKGGIACTDATWRRTQILVNNQEGGRKRTWIRWGGALAAAAAIMIVAIIQFSTPVDAPNQILAVGTNNVAEFAATSAVPQNREAVQNFLDAHGINLTLAEFNDVHPESHHPVKLLGASERAFKDAPVVELLYNCCGYPVKLAISKEGGEASRLLQNHEEQDEVQKTRLVGEYRVAVVGEHKTQELLDLLG